MSVIRWLQLSDLHFGLEDYTTEAAFYSFYQYLDSIIHEKESKNEKPEYLFITGDMLYAPKAQKEAHKLELIQQSRTAIRNIQTLSGIQPENTFVVPGNHDVNRDGVYDNRGDRLTMLYEAYRPNDGTIDDGTIQKLLGDFDSFQSLTDPNIDGPIVNISSLPTRIHSYVDMKEFGLVLMNTAFSYGKDYTTKLIFGVKYFQSILRSIPRCKPIIILAHHPLDDALEHDKLENELVTHQNIKLYLCGHEHRFLIHTLPNNKVKLFNNPTFMDEDKATKEPCQIGFTFGEMDSLTGHGYIEAHLYDAAFDFWDKYRQFGGNQNSSAADRLDGIYRFGEIN